METGATIVISGDKPVVKLVTGTPEEIVAEFRRELEAAEWPPGFLIAQGSEEEARALDELWQGDYRWPVCLPTALVDRDCAYCRQVVS
jgi:hypothetical protein